MQIEQWARYRAKDHLEAVVSSFTLLIHALLARCLRDIDSTTNFYRFLQEKRKREGEREKPATNKLDPLR